MSVRYTEEAETDLTEALAYLAERNPAAAQDLYARVTTLVNDLDAGVLDGPTERLKTGEKTTGQREVESACV